MNLFKELVSEKELHPNFVNIKKDEYKIKILEKWADEKIIYRDGNDKFIKEFQTTFNSSFWELYCYQVLKKLKCEIEFNYDFPDFVFKLSHESLLIECTIANNALNKPAEHDMEGKFLNWDIENIIDEQIVRLSNAFNSKYKKYIQSYVKHNWVEKKPYIIAIEPFEQPYFMITGTESIRQLLYGWKHIDNTRQEELVSYIYKNKKVTLPLGLFKSKDYEEVSAVLFSNVATVGKVDAMSTNPDSVFLHLRYNLEYDRPLIQIDCKIKQSKNDIRCQTIKKNYEFLNNLNQQYTIRRPLIRWDNDYKEDICDGLILFVNPYAKNPISTNTLNEFYNSGINIVEYDSANDIDKERIHDHSLIQRQVILFK